MGIRWCKQNTLGTQGMILCISKHFEKTFVSDCFYRLGLSYSPIVSRYVKTNLFFGNSVFLRLFGQTLV